MSIYPTPCPVDGCDRGPFDDEKALRGHVNASGGSGHDWEAVKEELATSEEGGKAGDGSDADDQPEGGNEGDNPAPEGDEVAPAKGEDQPEEGDDTDMPTQQEYEDQHTTGDGDEGSGDGSTTDTPNTTSGSPLPSLPMDPKTLGMLLAVALVLWLSYRALSGPSDSDQPTTSGEQAKAGDGTETGDQQPEGGLTG